MPAATVYFGLSPFSSITLLAVWSAQCIDSSDIASCAFLCLYKDFYRTSFFCYPNSLYIPTKLWTVLLLTFYAKAILDVISLHLRVKQNSHASLKCEVNLG